jgi:hypothetical protein
MNIDVILKDLKKYKKEEYDTKYLKKIIKYFKNKYNNII